MDISIHALREEGDAEQRLKKHSALRFLSTPSARRATRCCFSAVVVLVISIHALREEGDMLYTGIHLVVLFIFLSTPSARRATCGQCTGCRLRKHFYPRPPRGGRLSFFGFGLFFLIISIHALREEGDTLTLKARLLKIISIHALREEGDWQAQTVAQAPHHFYPRPPRGGRHGKPRPWRKHHIISIHALREEGDCAT